MLDRRFIEGDSAEHRAAFSGIVRPILVHPSAMSKRPLRFIILLSVIVSMSMGMLPIPGGHWNLHSPMTSAVAQARLAVVEIAEHGHVHDEGNMDERVTGHSPTGHSHGHNPADHTHETPNLPANFSLTALSRGQAWKGRPPFIPVQKTAYRLERPPRPILPV